MRIAARDLCGSASPFQRAIARRATSSFLGELRVAEHDGIAFAREAGAADSVRELGAPALLFGLGLELDLPEPPEGEKLGTEPRPGNKEGGADFTGAAAELDADPAPLSAGVDA